jgi:hypothetical protein
MRGGRDRFSFCNYYSDEDILLTSARVPTVKDLSAIVELGPVWEVRKKDMTSS